MTNLLLFHHALGLTPGVVEFADEIRAAGHTVTTPDLYDGALFDSVEEGVSHAREVGFDTIIDRGFGYAAAMGGRFVVAGFSLGVLPAQKIAQTHQGAVGAILYHGAVPITEFGSTWPAGVPVQIHFGEEDPWAQEDLEAAQEFVAVAGAELFMYPGSGHLIADSSFTDYAPEPAAQIMQRTLEFLAGEA
jgi:dienelactone hydrolase